MSSTLFRTKKVEQSIQDTEEPEHALKKSLSALDLTVFGVGVIIRTGIFFLTGTVAKNNSGPDVALAFEAARDFLTSRRRFFGPAPGAAETCAAHAPYAHRTSSVPSALATQTAQQDLP